MNDTERIKTEKKNIKEMQTRLVKIMFTDLIGNNKA